MTASTNQFLTFVSVVLDSNETGLVSGMEEGVLINVVTMLPFIPLPKMSLSRSVGKEINEWLHRQERLNEVMVGIISSFVHEEKQSYCDKVPMRTLEDACIPSWTAIVIVVLIVFIAAFIIASLYGLASRAKKIRRANEIQVGRTN